MNIPTEIFSGYFEAIDEFINNPFIGRDIILFYKEQKTQINDTIHTLNLVDGPSTNYGADGQLTPFNDMAGGTTYSEVETSSSIRVRWYPNPKEWNRIITVNIPEVKVLIIGFLSDLDKLQRANQIGYNFGGQIQRFALATQPQKWGFGNRYFIGQLREI